ncbi:tol-pal system YbgF family protein [Aquimarina sp. I32.4]|uniref:tetratricopeptide repeat protein n=1 Tax=Aquimarina sp. I32.4 TaxID=2053903 RepID=UPI000CDE8B83|nr:hypothetical protein [Aquimarina sp. I32.4]
MKRTPEIFDRIEGYINNTLTQDELTAFEKELAINSELQQETQKHREMHKILGDQDTLDFKEKLMRISANIHEEKQKVPSTKTYSYYLKIAASIAILIGIGTFWYLTNAKNQIQDLYKAYYEPFPVEDIVRGNTNKEIQHIIKNYTSHSYDSVIVALEKYPDIENQHQLQLYLGNSYLNTNCEEKAIPLFIKIKNKSKYYEVAKWYLSLSYLKVNKPKKAIPLLNEIIRYNGAYKNKAKHLLTAIEK